RRGPPTCHEAGGEPVLPPPTGDRGWITVIESQRLGPFRGHVLERRVVVEEGEERFACAGLLEPTEPVPGHGAVPFLPIALALRRQTRHAGKDRTIELRGAAESRGARQHEGIVPLA